MAMQQCPNGHLYDDAKNSSCPYCSDNSSVNVTVPLTGGQSFGGGNAFPATAQLDGFNPPQPGQGAGGVCVEENAGAFPKTEPIGEEFEKTKYVEEVVNDKGIVEVRGWLVCLEGAKRGVDFKIHGEKNTIGRGAENDIKIDFDSSISKGVNAIISYDIRKNKFFIWGGESKNNIYINDDMLMNPVELKDYDIIEIGSTKMIFRSLCNEAFNWEKAKAAEKAE